MPKTKKTTPRSDRDVIEDIIKAWNSLPGGRRYTPADVESWLVNRMGPAINDARRHIEALLPKG